MTRTLVPLAAALAAAPFLVATASAQGLTIHSANMTFATGALSPTTPTAPELDLRATAGGPDHGYRHGWFYRLAGDPQEYAFAGLGPSTASVTAAQDHADRDFADVDNRGLLRAALDCDTYSTGATTGFATSRLTVRNVSAVAQTIDLFAYVDLDVGGTFNNDIAIGAPMLHAVRDWTGVQIEVRAVDADRSDVLAHPLLLNLLTDANVDDLGNHAPPFAGDYTSAFQWSAVVLTPGEQRSFTLVLAVDETATDAAVVEAYGRGSTAGAEIHTDSLPVQDPAAPRPFGIHMAGGLPNAPMGLLVSMLPRAGVAFLGLEVWVEHAIGPRQLTIGNLDASGAVSLWFNLPPNPDLTGMSLYYQYFYVDPSVPAGAGHTAALSGTIGGL